MNPLLRSVAVLPLLGLCTVLTAQEGGKPTPPAPSTEKPASQAPSKEQDALLAKDPAIKAIDKFISEQKIDKEGTQWKTRLVEPPKQSFDPATDYFLDMQTSVGALRIRLLPAEAPMHVTCGLYLARLGFYDGLNFHRIIPAFMAQGGDPLGSGSGGPGYTIEGEFGSGRKHDKPGLLSTANTNQPKSDGSQFFLTFVPTPWLDNKHTIWGEVVDGMDTVKALEKLGNREGRVPNPPKIEKVTVSLAPKAKPAGDKAKDGGDKAKEGKEGNGK